MTDKVNRGKMTSGQQWAAGVLSVMGSLMLVEPKTQLLRPHVRLVLKTTRPELKEAFLKLSDELGADISTGSAGAGKEYYMMQLSGKMLHTALTLLWDGLMPARKREYITLYRRAKEMNRTRDAG